MVQTLFKRDKRIDTDDIPPIIGNVIYSSNKEKVNIINDFFIKRPTLQHQHDTPPDPSQLDCQLIDITLSLSEVSNIIQNLDNSKSIGPDQVHNRLIIAASSELLTILFNRSLSKASFLLFGKFLVLAP